MFRYYGDRELYKWIMQEILHPLIVGFSLDDQYRQTCSDHELNSLVNKNGLIKDTTIATVRRSLHCSKNIGTNVPHASFVFPFTEGSHKLSARTTFSLH